jgi:hypothetical protein
LAVLRIGVALLLLVDFLDLAVLDLVPTLWAPQEAGGIPTVLSRKVMPIWYRVFPPSAASAWALWCGMVGSAGALAVGFRSRTAALILMLLSAQAAQITPLASRGIDVLLRNVLLVLAFSGAGRTWSVDTRLRTGAWVCGQTEKTPSWPRQVIVLQMITLYLTAGLQKTGLPWTPLGDFSALYIVLRDPTIASGPMPWLESVYPLTQFATALTVCFELSAGLLPWVYWFRLTADRPGRLRAWVVRWRPQIGWLGLGVGLHLGIAATMALGIFPWALLALYPAFLHPDEARDGIAKAKDWLQRRSAARPK